MITTLTGPNAFLLQRELRRMIDGFLAEHDELGLERIDGEEAEFDRMRESLTSLPFLAAKKLVVLRSAGANKQFSETIEKTVGELPETTDVVLAEPKLDKRSSYYKFLKKSTDFKEFNELDANGLSRWLVAEAKAAGGSLGQADARLLVDRVGLNQQALSHELDKLLLYQPAISRQSIELLSEASPQSTVFELLEAAFAGNGRRALALYDEQRALKVEPQQIIAMLTWQLHVLALIKIAGAIPPEAIAKEAKMSPYVIKKSAATARKLSLPQLKKLVESLLEIDRRSKREALDLDAALQHYLLALASQ